jgi:hypothetical protein
MAADGRMPLNLTHMKGLNGHYAHVIWDFGSRAKLGLYASVPLRNGRKSHM